jgi:hypothetical protein
MAQELGFAIAVPTEIDQRFLEVIRRLNLA